MTRLLRVEPWLIICLALSVLANQTFSSVGLLEILLGASLLWTGALAAKDLGFPPRIPIQGWPAIFLMASITISALMGLITGSSFSAIFRATAPYMVLGLALPFIVSGKIAFDRKFLLIGVLIIATFHAVYLIGLFLFLNERFDSAFHVLVNRITLADNRAMNPVYLIAPAAAIAIYAMPRLRGIRVLTIVAAVASIIAAFATASRAFAAATLLAPTAFLVLSLPFAFRHHARKVILASAGALTASGLLLLFIPPFSIMPDAMFLRHDTQVTGKQAETTETMPSGQPTAEEPKTAVGGGRLTDEWPSAWRRFTEGSIPEKIFGIGAGNSFTLKDGTERTYIHNWPLYLLLYQGVFGVVAFTLFIVSLSTSALVRWWRHNDLVSLGSLGILATMYSSSLFFSNHKLISFNLLLVIIYLMEMRPQKA